MSRGGAEHLARIHGTEEDKVNCPFYFKIGACRHGDRCSRQHHKPAFSQTILIDHLWQNPYAIAVGMGVSESQIDANQVQDDFNEIYEELYEEMRKFGKVEDIQVCENLGDHMVGNVYVKFEDEEDAESALRSLQGRYYGGRPIACNYSPVTDFREARCRQFDEGSCSKGGYCNFMHVRQPSNNLRRYLEKKYGFKGGKNASGDKRDGGGSLRRDRDNRDRRSRSRERSRRSRSRSRDRYRR